MMFPLVLLAAILVAAVQLVLCFRARFLWVKLLPLGLLVSADGVCWLIYASSVFSEIYGADFAAYIYGVLLALFAGADVLCWGMYGLVCAIRKRVGKRNAEN